MKKEKVLFVIMIGIIIVQFASASVERVCSDGKNVSWSQKELKQGTTKVIGMLNIALIGADESVAFGRAGVSLIIDAKKILIINKSSNTIEINEKGYTLTLVNASDESAKITFNGQTKEILLDEFELMGLLPVYLDNSYSKYEDDLPAADLIIGSSQMYLTSEEMPYRKINITNTTYLIELISASDDNAMLRVSSCPYADIIEIREYKKIIREMEINNSQNNSNAVVNNTNTTVQPKKQIGGSCLKNEECFSEYCKKEKCVEPTQIQKIINWFKKTFSWK